MSIRKPGRIFWLGLPVVGVALLSAGCVPGVAWLPDSSGFIYSNGQDFHQIVHYDLARKQARVLVANTRAATLTPALRPDGKQIAVARLERNQAAEVGKLEVILYGLDGKEQHAKTFDWAQGHQDPGNGYDRDGNPLKVTQLFWTPRGNKLIILGDNTTGIYDVQAQDMKTFPGMVPAIVDTTPLTPDGKAFLAVKLKKGSDGVTGMSLVDLEGKETPIPLKEEMGDHPDKQIMLRFPFLFTLRWEGAVAVVHFAPWTMRIDTARREATCKEVGPIPGPGAKRTIRSYKFPEGGVEIRISEVNRLHRLEVLRPGDKGAVISKEADWWLLTPAPNGKLVAARGVDKSILIINHEGELVTEVETDDNAFKNLGK